MDFDYTKEKFIMVSYSHRDMDIVSADVNALRGRGVPVWYDDRMEVGDNWKHEAEKYIKHPNCIGVVFYVSKWSFVSPACEDERNWYKEKPEPKFYLGVHMEGKTIDDIQDDVYSDGETRGLIRGKGYLCATNQELFYKEKLFCSRPLTNAADDATVQKIYEQAAKYGIIREFVSDIEKGSGTSRAYVAEVKYKLNLGEFINLSETKKTVRVAGESRNKRAGDNIIYEGYKYPVRKLSWVLLEETPETKALILEDVLCKRHGGEALVDWLNTEFTDIAFSGELCEIIRNKLDLATADELKRAKIPEAELNDKYVEWWIADTSPDGDIRQQVAYGGEVWSYGWLPLRQHCYVRPVLRLDKGDYEKVINILNGN